MALAEMCKARIAVHKSAAEELVGKLQALGCCEFIAQDGAAVSGGAMAQLRAKQRRVEELLGDARFASRLLEPLAADKESPLARMLGDVPGISLSDLAKKVDEEKFSAFVAELREKERSMTERRAEISRFKGLLGQTALLEAIQYPLEFFTTGTAMIGGAVYSVPKASAAGFASALKSELGDLVEYQELPSGEKDAAATFAVLCRKEDNEKLQGVCADFSANRIEVPRDFERTASEEKERLASEIAKLEESEASICADIASRADEGLEMARCCGDYWTILRDRLESMVSGLPTEDVLIWSFWMPVECRRSVENALKPYESLMEYAMVEPDEDELPPTLLKNASWSSCMEPLTLMYGTPTYGAVDPTSLMAPFFFLFLGMCFGDAGYGLILSGIFGYFIVKHRLTPTLRKFFVMLAVGMVFSVLVGALTGSWFGDSITAFPFLAPLIPFKDALQFLDPMNDPMTLLVISLALGFIQVIFGLMIAFGGSWRAGDKVSAVCDQGGWMVFLIGLVLVGLSMSGTLGAAWIFPSKCVAIAGAFILVATQGRTKAGIAGKLFSGVMSLYNVTGYLGDVLSYSRLLALGLGSAAVGMVINLLCTLVAGDSYVGMFFAVVIFVAGHTFSIAVNLLGAFIHSLRLQYVEFFGKFYDANGKDFTPLRNATSYARLTEDPAGR